VDPTSLTRFTRFPAGISVSTNPCVWYPGCEWSGIGGLAHRHDTGPDHFGKVGLLDDHLQARVENIITSLCVLRVRCDFLRILEFLGEYGGWPGCKTPWASSLVPGSIRNSATEAVLYESPQSTPCEHSKIRGDVVCMAWNGLEQHSVVTLASSVSTVPVTLMATRVGRASRRTVPSVLIADK